MHETYIVTHLPCFICSVLVLLCFIFQNVNKFTFDFDPSHPLSSNCKKSSLMVFAFCTGNMFSKYCEVCGVVRRSIVIPSLSNHSRLTPPRSLTRSNVTALSYSVTFKSQSGCFRGSGGLTAIFKEL